MLSTTPYLVRAIYEWCIDQRLTPHLLVDASIDDVSVPQQLVENNTIVLNLRPSAVKFLDLGDERICFRARFSGQAMDIVVPVIAVRAIFAEENGQGCVFEPTQTLISAEEASMAEGKFPSETLNTKKPTELGAKPRSIKSKPSFKTKKKKSHLKLVD